MKKNILLAIFSGFAMALSAQITLTNATFPAVGDTLKTAVDAAPTGIQVTAEGPNQAWDYSSLSPDVEQETIYRPASEGSVGSLLPTADAFVGLGAGNVGETYYNITTTAVERVALNGNDPIGLGLPSLFRFTPPAIERRAPLVFGASNSSTSSVSLPFSSDLLPATITDSLPFVPDSFRIRLAFERMDKVDAWGKLTIPGGTFDVLREKRTEFRETKIEAKVPFFGWLDVTALLVTNPNLANIGKDTTSMYYFFSNNSKEPIAVATMDPQDQNVTSMTYKNGGTIVSGIHENIKNATVSISPNPAHDFILFNSNDLKMDDYSLTISNLAGQLILRELIDNSDLSGYKLDISGLSDGIYFYQILDKKGQLISGDKFVKN